MIYGKRKMHSAPSHFSPTHGGEFRPGKIERAQQFFCTGFCHSGEMIRAAKVKKCETFGVVVQVLKLGPPAAIWEQFCARLCAKRSFRCSSE